MPVGFAREFVQLTKESAYGVPMTTPVRGTDQIAIRLEDGNSFTPRADPVTVPVMYGGGNNVEADTISDKTAIRGNLTTTLCYSQAPILLGLALQKIDSAHTLPWPHTDPEHQLASVCADHAIWQDDTGSYKRTRYTGCKVDGGNLAVSSETQKATLSLELIGSKYEGNTYDSSTDPTALAFPQPADDEYPTDYVLFGHSCPGFLLDDTAFIQYLSLSCNWTYGQVVNYFCSRFVQQQRTWGRKLVFASDVILRSTPDLRAAYQTLARKKLKLIFANGTNTITLDWQTNARIEGLTDTLPLAENYMRTLTIGSRHDGSTGVEFSYTYA